MRRRRKKRKHIPKEHSLFVHVGRRAMERFGLELTTVDQDIICNMICGEKATFVRRESHRVTVWDVTYNGANMRVCYDKERGQLITVIPSPSSAVKEAEMFPSNRTMPRLGEMDPGLAWYESATAVDPDLQITIELSRKLRAEAKSQ